MSASDNRSVPERLDRLEDAMQVVLTALHPRRVPLPARPSRSGPVAAEEAIVLAEWIHDLLHTELDRFGGRLEPPATS